MLNIEVIRFEAQDVITASVAAPAPVKCTCDPVYCDFARVQESTGLWPDTKFVLHDGCNAATHDCE